MKATHKTKQLSQYEHLKKRWTKKHVRLHTKVWEKHKDSLLWLQNSFKQIAASSMAGLLLLTNPVSSSIVAQALPTTNTQVVEKKAYTKDQFITDLSSILPTTVQPLTSDQETKIGQLLSEHFNMPVSAELEGKRLNRSYGLIGAEQHLMRYPGDTIDTHFSSYEEANQYYNNGMAPGRGAWGYFADSQANMTDKDVQREKYYIAVQTFLAPGWQQDPNAYYQFFKYRKMLVVNPDNGKAIIADIGDAGPGEFTGKHLGGSPEVMKYLERKDGAQKGPVLYFFIDDKNDTVPLGPITLQ